MDTPSDSTRVLRMKEDFDFFLSKSTANRGANQSQSGWSQASVATKLSFDNSQMEAETSTGQNKSSLVMADVMEKRRADKLKEAELLAAKSEICKLQMQISSVETSRKRARVDFEQEKESIHQGFMREQQKNEELKAQLKFLADKEEESKQKATEYRRQAETFKANYEQRILALQKEKLNMENQLQDVQDSSRNKMTEMRNKLRRQETETEICRNELEETKEQLSLQIRRAMDSNTQRQEAEELKLQVLNAEQKIRNLEQRLMQYDEDILVNKSMRSQISKMPELEKENRQLKEQNQLLRDTQENIHLLKEKVESLTSKLARAEQRCQDFTYIQMENEELKNKLQKWEHLDPTGPGRPQSPTELSRRFVDLQSSQAILLEKQGELQTRTNRAENEAKSNEAKFQQTLQRLTAELNKSQQVADLVKRLQRKLLFVTKERDGYKQIIDSYESEVTVNVASHSNSRISHLEQTLASYQRHIAQLEAELEGKTTAFNNITTKCSQLELKVNQSVQHHPPGGATSEADQKTIQKLRENVEQLTKQLGKIEEEKYVLETRIEQRHLQGDYDPTKTKVLHFAMNPTALAQKRRGEELGRLQEENAKLKKRLEVLEESGAQAVDVTMQVQSKLQEPSTSKELVDMRSQLTTAELKNKRLMEAFTKTSQEFREVCYSLTGFKIVMANNQYRLMSMFAESPADVLLFQQGQGGVMQLLSTDFSSTLEELIETYLQERECIPAFLASVTLELFGRQTMIQ